jgi:steroid delta-isomerase
VSSDRFSRPNFASSETKLTRWYRTGLFFCNGRHLTWKYSRETLPGDHEDPVEVMDVGDGLISHHRIRASLLDLFQLAATPGIAHGAPLLEVKDGL